MTRPGEVHLADLESIGPHYVVVLSREELNRGRWVMVALISSRKVEVRSKLRNCVPITAGEFGLTTDCVVLGESVINLLHEELLEHVGTLDDDRMREVVRAVGYAMGAECEPN